MSDLKLAEDAKVKAMLDARREQLRSGAAFTNYSNVTAQALTLRSKKLDVTAAVADETAELAKV